MEGHLAAISSSLQAMQALLSHIVKTEPCCAAAAAATLQRNAAAMEVHLAAITSSLQAMQALLLRMGERCDPYVY
jgi:hypothetical protein